MKLIADNHAILTRREAREKLVREVEIAAEGHRQGGGRQSLQMAFFSAYEFIRSTVPQGTDLSALAYLGAALHDLDDGLQRPEFKPASRKTAQYFEKRRSLGYAAAAVEAFMEEGVKEEDANRIVASSLDKFWPLKKVSATTIDNWRSDVRADPTHSHASQGYREAQEAWQYWRGRFRKAGLPEYTATEFLSEFCETKWARLLSHLQPKRAPDTSDNS